MCWGLHIMEGDKVVKRIDTVGDAFAFFGSDFIRYHSSDRPVEFVKPGAPGDYCLCPIDVEMLVEKSGYKFIDHTDPRWDPFDHRIEEASIP
jgi:hypothetical protein